jgi:signal transduction histidine kinase
VPANSQYLLAINGENEHGESLNTRSIVGMLKDSSGRLWLDTPGGLHLANFGPDGRVKLENHREKTGFGGRPMGANLLEDQKGRIWSPSFIYNPASETMTPLQRADGMDIGTSSFRSFNKTAEGKFLYGGSRGLLMVDPNNFSYWDYKPPLVVSELRIDGVHANAGKLINEGLTLSPKQRSFSIEFSALDLSAPEKNRYRYKLNGFDKDWVEVDATRRIASYGNLWPGEYGFEVQGTNRAGQWSDQQLKFKVTIEAAYWQTPWFIALCVILAFSLIYQGFRIRTQWIKARAEELKIQVEERTRELKKAQKDFIEQEKMASLGGLVAGVSHEINTPMGIALTAATALSDDSQLIDGKVKENRLKRSELNKYLEKSGTSLKIILSSLERACELMASFKQVAVDQTSEQRRKFDMKTLLQDIERSLHSLYAKRGHQLEIDCPDHILLDSYPGAVFQVFTNLINNSIIHGFKDDLTGTIRVKVTKTSDSVLLRYSDDGIGMTPEVRDKAFEPFFTTKLGVGGSGLGLHLVYNYISQVLGGRIDIDPAVPKGFTCHIELPLKAPLKKESPSK